MSSALISIIIPTFNRADLIAETLESVQRQTYPHFECIIIDDGSTDHTEEVVSAFAKADKRFSYHLRPSIRAKGGNGARNHGIELSKGAYLNFLDSDDLLHPEKLKYQIELLQEEKNCMAICPWSYFSDQEHLSTLEVLPVHFDDYHDLATYLDDLALSVVFFPPHAFLISRVLCLSAGEWDERLMINQDGEFFARVYTKVDKIKFTPHTAVYYRVSGDGNISKIATRDKAIAAVESWKLIENHFLRAFGRSTKTVQMAKKNLSLFLKDNYPDLLSSYKQFLFGDRSAESSHLFHFVVRLKAFIKRNFSIKF